MPCRYEYNSRGERLEVDIGWTIETPKSWAVDGLPRHYALTTSYAAMYMLTRKQLGRFISSEGKFCWNLSTWIGGRKLGLREMAAFGPMDCCLSDDSASCMSPLLPAVVEGGGSGNTILDPDAGIWHIGQNYVQFTEIMRFLDLEPRPGDDLAPIAKYPARHIFSDFRQEGAGGPGHIMIT